MSILVAYVSKHGATGEIAERIAEDLRAAGQHAGARPVQEAGDLGDDEGIIKGSAAHSTHWLKDAAQFVRRNRGPLGDDKGADDVGATGKKPLNVMKVQRNSARDEIRAFKALGLSPEQSTALTRKPEGEGPDIDAIKATATRGPIWRRGFVMSRERVGCCSSQTHGWPHDA
jgi:hypothetical protein